MDRRQKSTLRSHHIHLANELILDEDFFAALRQNKIFTDGMLQIIKDVRKPRDQVYKMLELLEKRGPDAFENFVWILKENFSWIAEKLEETYQMKQSREKSAHHQFRRAMSTPQDSRRKLRPQTSVQIPPGATNNFQNSGGGKKVFFKSDSPEPSRDDEDINYDDVDEQDGGAVINKPSTKHNSEMNTIVRRFADKCLSPIQIIESPRKELTASCSSTGQPDQSQNDVDSDSKFNSEQVANAEIYSDNNNIANIDMEGDESVFDDDGNDMGELDELNVDDENGEFEDGEIFYDRIRSEMHEAENNDSFELGDDDIDGGDIDGGFDQTIADDMESHATSFEFGPSEDDTEIQDMYSKLLDATNTDQDAETDLSQVGITYKMINELIDKLVQDKINGEESMKIIKKCVSLFPEKDRKFALSKNIEKLMEEKADINNRLFEEIRKTNEMAHDMYMHSQEMKSLDKLKARMSELEKENSLLQMKKLNVERESQEKDRRINELEKNMKLFEEVRQNGADKKGLTRRNSQRRIAPSLTSPRKPSLGPGSTNVQRSNPGSLSSPRPGASSAWPRHYPKR